MKLRLIKDILFSDPKPFKMKRAQIDDIALREQTYNHLNELTSNLNEVLYEINNSDIFKSVIDYKSEYLKKGQHDVQDLVQKLELPNNNSSIFKKAEINVGIVCDEFLYDALEGSCNLYYLNSSETIDNIDFVIIASTWTGIDGYWKGNTQSESEKSHELLRLIENYKSKNIPIVFINKEDPVNFDIFIKYAKVSNLIFTTARESVQKYKEILPNTTVEMINFPINIFVHNPIGSIRNQNNSIMFAGSWMDKYKERSTDMRTLIDGVIQSPYNLTIVDRNFYLDRSDYQYPGEYMSYITAKLDHKDLMKLHKIYPNAININTIKYSMSMCANRAFELSGFGNFILSNYNAFLNMHMPEIQMIFDENDVEQSLKVDPYIIQRAKSLSIQKVMFKHTQFHFLNQIVKGLKKDSILNSLPEVSIVIEKDNANDISAIDKQTYEFIKIVNDVKEVDTELYTYFSSNYNYEPEYISDLVSACVYTRVSYITKDDDNAHEYVDNYHDKYLTLFEKDSILSKGYALPETFVNSKFIAETNEENKEEILTVVVPVHNNGSYLEHKCLRSIIKHPRFKEFRVLLIDDGSTDVYTSEIISLYATRYNNIDTIKLEKASGSASKPRNVGIKHTITPFITFLDPDNEWASNGISTILGVMEHDPSIDLCVGNMLKVDNQETRIHNYYNQVMNVNNIDVVSDTPDLLKKTKLKTASIQALIAKTSLIKNNNLTMVEGALGQDSLFFLELVHYSNKIRVVNNLVHIYYAAVDNSVTNVISPTFFEKYYILEQEKIKFLKKHKYLDIYMMYRFNYYVKNWYLIRLKKTNNISEESIKNFLKIYDLYKDYSRPHDKPLEESIRKLKGV